MTRIQFETNKQREFIDRIIINSNSTVQALANSAHLHARTIRDWRREKYKADFIIIKSWSKKYDVPLSEYKTKVLSSFWYGLLGAKKGGERRIALYGSLGTPEGRSKGGRESQKNRKENPKKYAEFGCIVNKTFHTPKYSTNLAELCGIIMGDGGITNYQVKVTLSKLVDLEYSKHVVKLFNNIFGELPSINTNRIDNTITLTLSGVLLVKILGNLGLKRGNKIAQQIDYPQWIEKNQKFKIACFRGLFDTDGGFYLHKKKSNTYLGWCFTSYSKPLIDSSFELLTQLGLKATIVKNNRIYIYNKNDIIKYIRIFGSNNPKNLAKYKLYTKPLK